MTSEDDTRALPRGFLHRTRRNAFTGIRAIRLMSKETPEEAAVAAAKLVLSMGEMKGIAMKVGQIMSYTDFALPDEARSLLATLQTQAPPMPWSQVQQVLRAELGPNSERLLASMEPHPVAVASIGQVHKAMLDGAVYAVKVRHPGIAEAIRSDFRLAALGPAMAALLYPGAQIGTLMEEAKTRLLDECDYRKEAEYQEAFAELWAGHDVITVPRVQAGFTAAGVLTSEWVEGVHQAEWLAREPTQAERDRAGGAIWDFYLGSLFRHRIFNCDPHPGNQIYLSDGRVAIVDHGCTRRFSGDSVRRLAHLTLAVQRNEAGELDAAIREAGIVTRNADLPLARDLMHAFFDPLHDPASANQARMELGELIQAKRRLMRLQIPGEYLFLLRIRFGLAALLGRIGAEIDWAKRESDAASAAK
jgi:predicted unusual protein kinase regulating ubiquinone biosynthesis (AarF/ABC1/UbiB family)